MDKRPESRVSADIPVRVWGMDADGRPFFQNALACNLSSEGAQLSWVHHSLKTGEIIGIQYGDKKALFHVIWVKESGIPGRIEAGVKMLVNQQTPWGEVTAGNRPVGLKTKPGAEKRMFARHKVLFPLEISFSDQRRAPTQGNNIQTGGGGGHVWKLPPRFLLVGGGI